MPGFSSALRHEILCKSQLAVALAKTALDHASDLSISICMRTTLNIDDDLLGQAGEYTGETEKTALVRMGLEALIEREAARRLAALGGKMPLLDMHQRARTKASRGK